MSVQRIKFSINKKKMLYFNINSPNYCLFRGKNVPLNVLLKYGDTFRQSNHFLHIKHTDLIQKKEKVL